jgi:3-deoxy-D-manno-octulosonic-acid transferase
LLYNFIFIPLFFVLSHIGALFNKKIRQGIWGRYKNFKLLRKSKLNFKKHQTLVVHCASMGEFEHIKPFLVKFRKKKPKYKIVVLFFSPSGYQNIKKFFGVDIILYTPFDWFIPILRLMLYLRPKVWIIAKHDVWPNQIWIANLLKIPVFLINASFQSHKKPKSFLSKIFYQIHYSSLTKIMTVSERDRINFLTLVKEEIVLVAGDTKFDQVIFRSEESLNKVIFPKQETKNKWIIIAGSTWPEDHEQLLPAIQELQRIYKKILVVICPHEPTQQQLNKLIQQIIPNRFILYSNMKNYTNESIIIIDKIGLLANLYSFGKVAFVGGSFRQNVHNVLEPAVYQIPVLMGPINLNSNEAQLLKSNNGGYEVKNTAEIKSLIEKFILNDIFRQETGKKAYDVVDKNKGATKITVDTILGYLD